MTTPVFLKLIPPAFRQDISRSVNGRWTIEDAMTAQPDGRLTRRAQSADTLPNTDLELTLDNLGFGYPLRTITRPAVDRFERVTGVRLDKQLNPQWQTRTLAEDPVLNSHWLAKQLKRNRVNPDRQTANDAALSSPERYNWLYTLRQSITDAFDGFFSPTGNS